MTRENNIAYNPEKFHAYQKELEKKVKEAQARYDAKDDECWKHQNNPQLRYKLREIKEQPRILKRRKRLAGFYKRHYRYLPAFEQAYRIFKEEGLADNPIWLAHTMIALESYKVASLHDSDEINPQQTR